MVAESRFWAYIYIRGIERVNKKATNKKLFDGWLITCRGQLREVGVGTLGLGGWGRIEGRIIPEYFKMMVKRKI